ncbi:MAG: ABC transporter substrate-binding protein [Acidobacteria bacterium]|nr:ABC transporter substrate-binding protein [Acidobacteriota bacterium]
MNRQPRTLLTLLLIGAIAGTGYFLYRDLRAPLPGEPGASRKADVAPSRGGRLVATLRSEPRSFNRLVSANVVTELYSLLAQAKLVRINRATQELEPWLAERWEASADGRAFTLTLREGLQWSDGTPFSVEDVAFTFRAVYDARAGSVLGSTLQVDGRPLSATMVDGRTVRVEFPASFGPGLRLLDNLPILPRHRLEGALAAGTFAQAWNAATPPSDLAGMGPFRLARYEPGQRLVLERNPHYWRSAPDGTRLPYLDELVLEIVPDQNAELLRLQSGDVDLMQSPVRAEDLATLRPLEGAGTLQLLELGVTTDPDVFFFNLRGPYWAKDPRRAFITAREWRQAISHAVDREALAESVFLGTAVPIWGPVTPGNREWFSPNVPRYPYSIETAGQLLAGLGLANRDADEWREDAQGTEARFTVLTYRGNLVLEREAAFLRDELKKVGIAVDVVALEANALVDRMLRGDFEAIFFQYLASDLDPALSKDFWFSSGPAHIWNLAQPTPATPWEAEIDDLMRRQAAAQDPAERRRLFADVQRVFGENVPALYFVAPRLYAAANARVVNLTPAILRPQLLWAADTIAVRP